MIDKIELKNYSGSTLPLLYTEELKIVDTLNDLCDIGANDRQKELLQRFVSKYIELSGQDQDDTIDELYGRVEDLEIKLKALRKRNIDLEKERSELDSKCDLLTDEINLCRETMGD